MALQGCRREVGGVESGKQDRWTLVASVAVNATEVSVPLSSVSGKEMMMTAYNDQLIVKNILYSSSNGIISKTATIIDMKNSMGLRMTWATSDLSKATLSTYKNGTKDSDSWPWPTKIYVRDI